MSEIKKGGFNESNFEKGIKGSHCKGVYKHYLNLKPPSLRHKRGPSLTYFKI